MRIDKSVWDHKCSLSIRVLLDYFHGIHAYILITSGYKKNQATMKADFESAKNNQERAQLLGSGKVGEKVVYAAEFLFTFSTQIMIFDLCTNFCS